MTSIGNALPISSAALNKMILGVNPNAIEGAASPNPEASSLKIDRDSMHFTGPKKSPKSSELESLDRYPEFEGYLPQIKMLQNSQNSADASKGSTDIKNISEFEEATEAEEEKIEAAEAEEKKEAEQAREAEAAREAKAAAKRAEYIKELLSDDEPIAPKFDSEGNRVEEDEMKIFKEDSFTRLFTDEIALTPFPMFEDNTLATNRFSNSNLHFPVIPNISQG